MGLQLSSGVHMAVVVRSPNTFPKEILVALRTIELLACTNPQVAAFVPDLLGELFDSVKIALSHRTLVHPEVRRYTAIVSHCSSSPFP
jgi:hypothetical protein